MQNEDEKLIRLKQQRSNEAVDLAMQGRWRDAAAVNREIIESFPEDVGTYNRLGRAYMELGEYAQAREAYNHTVEFDPYNVIARKNLQRLKYLKETGHAEVETDKVEPHQFIEEIGKAGVVSLDKLAPREVLARMVAGDRVHLKVEGSSLVAKNSRGEYLGQVDSRPAQRLTRLMAGGNRYTAAVVSSAEDLLTVIIREVFQDPGQAGKLSFPPKGLEEVHPFAGDRVFKMEGDLEGETEEDDSGYTIIGGDEVEVLPEESADADDDAGSDEE